MPDAMITAADLLEAMLAVALDGTSDDDSDGHLDEAHQDAIHHLAEACTDHNRLAQLLRPDPEAERYGRAIMRRDALATQSSPAAVREYASYDRDRPLQPSRVLRRGARRHAREQQQPPPQIINVYPAPVTVNMPAITIAAPTQYPVRKDVTRDADGVIVSTPETPIVPPPEPTQYAGAGGAVAGPESASDWTEVVDWE